MKKKPRRRKIVIGVGITAAIVCLLLAGIACTILLRLAPPSANTPEGVAYNYQLALMRRDYEKAYRYLSPSLPHYPATLEDFGQDLHRYHALPDLSLDPCVHVESTVVAGPRAVVKMREQMYNPYCGLYEATNLMFTPFEMQLQLEDGKWRIVDSQLHFPSTWVQE